MASRHRRRCWENRKSCWLSVGRHVLMLACHWWQSNVVQCSIGHLQYVQANRLQWAETLHNHLAVEGGRGAVPSRDLNPTRSRGQVVITLIHARPLCTQLKEGGVWDILCFGVISVCVVGITVAFYGIMVTWPFAQRYLDLWLYSEIGLKVFWQFNVCLQQHESSI